MLDKGTFVKEHQIDRTEDIPKIPKRILLGQLNSNGDCLFVTTIAKQIKKHYPDLPVIAQTAYAMAGEKENILKAGCDGYISKPIQNEELFGLINEILQNNFH